MNKLSVIIVFSVISILLSCKSKDTNKESTIFHFESEIDTSLNHRHLPIYEIDTLLLGELEYILEEDKKNICYDSTNVGYSFHVINWENKGNVFLITSENLDYYDFSYSKGIFEFNNIRFVYSGLTCYELLTKTDKIENVSFYKKEPLIDDSKSSWSYLLNENEFILLDELSCGKLKFQNDQIIKK